MMPTLKELENAIHGNTTGEIRDILLSGENNSIATLQEQGLTFNNQQQLDENPLYLGYWVHSIRILLSSDYHAPETIEFFASIGIEA
jgi:hypothetical protein